jgi:hypothetical protein
MRCIAQPGLMAVLGKVADFPAIVAQVTGKHKLLWCPDCHLLLLCWQSVVVLLLLRLLWAIAPELWRRTVRLSRRWGIDHVVLWGAPLELPPVSPGTALILFFSSGASQAFMVPSWSITALTSSLYDRF